MGPHDHRGLGRPVRRPRLRPTRSVLIALVTIGIVVSACGTSVVADARNGVSAVRRSDQYPTTTTRGQTRVGAEVRPTPVPASTTTSAPVAPPTTAPLGASPPPGPGFLPGVITAVGDSVMLDYQGALQQDLPGVRVDAAVSRQWADGETLLGQLRAAGQLGAVVIVGLGTNGPVTLGDFRSMMSILSGASRVVFVNVVVDRLWATSVNAVLSAGVAQYPRAVLADWAALESRDPGWVYADGTHLPIDGPGAQALAALVASKV